MKRAVLIFTAAAMLWTTVPHVFAEETEYSRLIPEIKNRLDIPEEYSDFRVDSISETENGTSYRFTWSIPEKEDEPYSSISVSCDPNGIVTNYSNYQDVDRYDYLRTDITAGEAVAELFLIKMNPGLEGKIRLEPESGYLWGAVSYLVYEEYNGIEFSNEIGGISVTSSGVVTYADINEPEFSDEDVTELISIEDAYASYMENSEPKLVYVVYTDEDSIKTFPVYKKENQNAVSAVTGEIIEYTDRYGIRFAASTANAAAVDTGAGGNKYSGLTESEKQETARLLGYISSEEAQARVADFTGCELNNSNVYLNISDYNGTYYIYSDDIQANVDAASGDILYLSCYDKDASSHFAAYDFSDPGTAKTIIDAAAPKNGPMYSDIQEKTEISAADPDDDTVSRSTRFNYLVNGIKVENVYAEIRSNSNRGGTWYSISITQLDRIAAAEYDAPENFISANEALKQEDFKLRYVMTEDGARAAYMTEDFRINALTGKWVDYRNEEITDSSGEYVYSDIENHWIAPAARQLAMAGIGFKGGELKPDAEVTAAEAYELLDKQYYNYEKLFEDEQQPLTRNQTAQLIAECLGLTELADSDIFKAPYTDMNDHFGAVAILKGYGIIAADTDTFRPDDKITRAEFLQILYNTLSR